MRWRAHVASWCVLTCMAAMVLGSSLFECAALADTPPSSVTTAVVNPGQSYPEVPANSEAWFDAGGFCKVVDVGTLSSLSPTATGIPVFIPGPAAQWENYRTLAGTHYDGQLVLTTCCRPQANITNLCTEDGATPVPVSRQYGKLGETDTVTVTCTGNNGPYQDSVSLICSGDNGPDGQAIWAESGPDKPSCTTPPTTTYGACSTAGVGGWGNQLVTVTDCLGNSTSQGYTGPACYSPPPCTPTYACQGSAYVETCGGSSQTVGTCTRQTSSYTCSCDAGYSAPYTYACGTDSFYQCSSWNCSGSCVANPATQGYPAFATGSCSTGPTYPVTSKTCTTSYWAPP